MTATAALPARNHARRTSSGAGTGVRAFNRLAATCLTLFALIWLVPFLWAVITSLRPDNAITANPVTPWSGHWSLHAYTSTLTTNPIGWWYLNSFIISTLSVIFSVVACSMIGFGLAQSMRQQLARFRNHELRQPHARRRRFKAAVGAGGWSET